MAWYVKSPDGAVFGPASAEQLKSWADDSRITPEHWVSTDNKTWVPAASLPELEMVYLVEVSPGEVFGPYTDKVLESLVGGGELPPTARFYVLSQKLDEAYEALEKLRAENDELKARLASARAELAAVRSQVESAQAELADARGQVESIKQEYSDVIVIDPEVLEPEEVPQSKPAKVAPPKVAPLSNQATLEARLRSELLRARQKGMDFSFLKKR